jgi:PAS domain S-box-containing protein
MLMQDSSSPVPEQTLMQKLCRLLTVTFVAMSLLLAGAYMFTAAHLSQLHRIRGLIYLAGHQKMLTQRIMWLSLQANKDAHASHLESLRIALAEFNQGQKKLWLQNEFAGFAGSQDEDFLKLMRGRDETDIPQLAQTLSRKVDLLLNKESSSEEKKQAIEMIGMLVRGPLLDRLRAVSRILETHQAAHVEEAQTRHKQLSSLMMILLVISGLSIWWLIRNRIKPAMYESGLDRDKIHDQLKSLKDLHELVHRHAFVFMLNDQGDLLQTNERFSTLTGYPLNDLIGKSFRSFMSDLHPDEFWKNLWQQLCSGQQWDGEISLQCHSRGTTWLDLIVSPIAHTANRERTFIGIGYDITERKRQEIELKQQGDVFRTLTQLSSDWYWEQDEQFRFTRFSENYRILDWKEITRRAIGRVRWEIADWEPITQTWEEHKILVGRHEPFRDFIYRKVGFDGKTSFFCISGSPYFDESGYFKGYRGVGKDITAQKVAEMAMEGARRQAEDTSRFKSQFLANVSHEIRTPLNAVLGMLQLLKNSALDERQHDHTRKCEAAARSLVNLLNDILDFSKIEVGKISIDPQPFNINQLLEELNVILTAIVGNKPVKMNFVFKQDLPQTLIGDDLKIKQVLLNLAGNAVKFTQLGEVVLQIQLLRRTPTHSRLRFSVTDTGMGISEENQRRIFTGFEQGDASIGRRFGGTGLGLSISQGLVQKMGGELKLQSELGKGSIFWFDLELPIPSDNLLAPPASLPALPNIKQRILIIDKHEKTRVELVSFAASLGWESQATDDLNTGCQLWREAAQNACFDAVFIDLDSVGHDHHPEVDAFKKELETLLAPHAAMIGVVNQADPRMASSGIEAPTFDAFITKPVTAQMMLDVLRPNRPLSLVPLQPKLRLNGVPLLLVEDNPLNQEVARELLSFEGAIVDVLADGIQALSHLAQHPQKYAIVLMDIQMPILDGMEATRRIRHELGLVDLPIIAMTANALKEEIEKCHQAGMNDHISKPFEHEAMVNQLLSWLQPAPSAPSAPDLSVVTPSVVAQLSSLSMLDIASALSRLMNNKDLLTHLWKKFLEDGIPSVEQISLPVEDNWEPLLREVHALKGCASTLGATALAQHCAKLEAQLRTPEPREQVAPLVEECRALYIATRKAAHQWLQETATEPS